MTLAPLLAAPAVVQLHALAALSALGLGIVQMAAVKGTALHRLLGRVWAGLLAGVALSSFAIRGGSWPFGFSWIHLLSIFTLAQLPVAVLAARRGNIHLHQRAMWGLFIGAMVITGLFTLLPGRVMHRVLFGG